MSTTHPVEASPPATEGRGHTIAIALGATVLMWLLLYVLMVPTLAAPGWLAIIVIAAVLLLAGVVAGRYAGAGWLGGARVGLTIGLIDLLVLGSMLGGERPGDVIVDGLVWIGGFLVAAVTLGAVGAALTKDVPRPANWTALLAVVTAATTFVLIVAGGIVTGLEAGLAVPGWLTAFDYPLVLFPLRLMQEDGGVYAEHTHRLWGLLVGLSAILLAVHLWRTDRRRWVVRLAAVVLLAVIVQGTLGGTRVTEKSLTLAITHGVFGQLVFAGMVVMAVVTSSVFASIAQLPANSMTAFDRKASTTLPLIIVVQLCFGALYRHLNAAPDVPTGLVHGGLAGHLVVAAVVATLALVVGGRFAAGHRDLPPVRRLGLALAALVPLQLLLGIAALIAVLLRRDDGAAPGYEVALTTAHQATGALILACSAALAVWTRRLDGGIEGPGDAPVTPPSVPESLSP